MASTIPSDLDSLLAPILDTALDAVVVVTPEGWVIGFNGCAETTFGWTKAEAIGQSLVELIIPEQLRNSDRLWLERLTSGGELNLLYRRIEIMALHRSGRLFPIELSVTTAPSSSGTVFVAFIRDITERRQAKAQIMRQALQNRLMFDIVSMASETDSFETALRHALEAICKMTGWPVGHAFFVPTGEEDTLRSSDIWVEAEPGLADSLRAKTASIKFGPNVGLPGRILVTGEPLWIPDTNADPNFPRKGQGWVGAFGFPLKSDGRVIAILEFFSKSVEPLDPEVLLTVQAIGEQVGRVFERNRMHSRNAIYENAPGFIAITEGPHHRFVFANRSYENIVNCTDLVGKTVAEALPDIEEQGFVETLDRIFKTGEPYIGSEVGFNLLDEATGMRYQRYADFVYQPVRSSEGVITGLFCEGYDVTARVEAAIEMEELQREVVHLSRTNAMATMAATLAHELNQPLTAIANYGEAGRRFLGQPNPGGALQASEAFKTITELAIRTGDLIRNVRDLTARRPGQRSEFDLSEAIAESVKLVEASAPIDAEIVNRTAQSILVFADRIQVQQVLINLLRNATESGIQGHPLRVQISAVAKGDVAEVSVDDSGAGVPAELAKSLFALTQSSKTQGMGIGLSISRTIVESHGGKVWLEKTGKDGSEFRFTLPLASARSAT